MPVTTSEFISGFSPQNIPGLAVWLDADDSNSVTQSAGVVSAWADRSPNALNMSQATVANRPTIESNVQNGRRALRFTTAQMLQSTANLTLGPAQTWFVSFRALAAGNIFFIEQGSNTNSVAGGFLYGSNLDLFGQNRGGTLRFAFSGTRGSVLFAVGTWYVASFVNSNVSTTASNDLIFNTNGTSLTTSFLSNSVLSGNATNLLYINNTSRVPGSNYMGEIIIYDRALTRGEVRLTERYLARKWGVALPIGHPYFTLPAAMRPFTPLDVSGCVLWLDAGDFGTLTLSGTSLTAWRDKSGLLNNASSVGGAHPVYQSNSSTGLPSVSFLSNNDAMLVSSNFNMTTYPSLCYFIVIRPGSTQPNTANAGILSTDTAGLFGRSLGFGAGNWQQERYTGFTNITAYTANVWTVVSLQFVGTTSATLTVNGTTYAGTANTITRDNTTGLKIGSYNSDTAYTAFNANFETSEILVYGANLTTLERQQIEVYLAQKWRLRSNLATANPMRLYSSLAPLFNPTLVPGCVMWHDAADFGTLTIPSGSNVSRWNDKSGNANFFRQNTVSAQPTYVATTSTRFPAIYFSTTSQFLESFSNNPVTGNGSRTLFMVVYTPTDDFSNRIMAGTGSHTGGTPPNTFGIDLANASPILYAPYVYTAADNTFTVRLQGMQCLYAYYNSAVSQIGGGYGFETFATKSTTLNTATTTWRIGLRIDGISALRGYICEFIFYNSALTTQQRQVVEAYIARKWNIALPVTHPYYSTPVV